MIKVYLSYNEGYKWFSENNISIKGYAFTAENQLLEKIDLIHYFSDLSSFDEFQWKIKQLNGLFSVVIRTEKGIWATVDHGRSFPLFYYHKNNAFVLTDNPDCLKDAGIPMVIEENNAMMLQLSGFVPGDKTLLEGVFQLLSGESLCYENEILKKEFHTEYLTKILSEKSREELKSDLKEVFGHVGKRMVQFLNGRQVVIPLSGGFDSRIIVYLLRKNNYSNVLCFTYGKQNTPELNTAQKTALNLGYEWLFIDYQKYFDYSFNRDETFKRYVDFAANYGQKFYLQEYFAMQELLKLNKLSENSVFVSGHSGAIAGHLLKKEMLDKDFSYLDEAVNSVFSLVFPKRKELKKVRKELSFLTNGENKYPSFLVYENWRFKETTAKLGLNSSKLWDFYGYEYQLPLWDKELFEFFLTVPLEHKYDKNLYSETLSELFMEYDVYFPNEELVPSEKLMKKMSLRHKIKTQFPCLKRIVNRFSSKIWNYDIQGTRFYTQEFVSHLKDKRVYRKMLSINGIYSAWYLQRVREKLK